MILEWISSYLKIRCRSLDLVKAEIKEILLKSPRQVTVAMAYIISQDRC